MPAERYSEDSLLRLVGPFCFALSSHLTKQGVGRGGLSPAEFTACRSLLNVLITLIMLASSSRAHRWRPRNPGLLLLRGIFGATAMLCYTESLALIPAANALIISRFHPMLGAIFSSFALNESMLSWSLVLPLISGLAGVVLVSVPEPGAPMAGSILAGLAAIFTAAAFTTVRALQIRREEPLLIVLAFNSAGLALGGSKLVVANAVASMNITTEAVWWLVGSAVAMQGAQQCITRLLRFNPTARGASASFLIAAWGVALAPLTGAPGPTAQTLLGCALICVPQLIGTRMEEPRKKL